MQPVTGPGHVVAGRYELLNVIGHGSMGTVWRIEVRDFPAFIIVDDKGNDFFAGPAGGQAGQGPLLTIGRR